MIDLNTEEEIFVVVVKDLILEAVEINEDNIKKNSYDTVRYDIGFTSDYYDGV